MKVGCVGGAGGGTFQGQASDDREQFSSLSRSESDKKPILISLGFMMQAQISDEIFKRSKYIFSGSEIFWEILIFNWKHIRPSLLMPFSANFLLLIAFLVYFIFCFHLVCKEMIESSFNVKKEINGNIELKLFRTESPCQSWKLF